MVEYLVANHNAELGITISGQICSHPFLPSLTLFSFRLALSGLFAYWVPGQTTAITGSQYPSIRLQVPQCKSDPSLGQDGERGFRADAVT